VSDLRDGLALVWMIGLFAVVLDAQSDRPRTPVWLRLAWYLAVPVLMIAFAVWWERG
jgi:hypothetical protein